MSVLTGHTWWVIGFDKTFLGDFDFRPGELPGGSPPRMFYYPGASPDHGRDGVLIGVEPDDAEPWIGMFADGGVFQSATYAVALPDRGSIAVVCGGASYRVAARDPRDWAEIAPVVVRAAVVLPASDLVLFLGFTQIVAWGASGHTWDTGPLVHDDLRIVSVTGHVLTITGSSPAGTTRQLTVDLRTGTRCKDGA
jgi:hypothetical protein